MAENLIGDTAVALLKAGAETDKKDSDGHLAIELAPDAQVSIFHYYGGFLYTDSHRFENSSSKVRKWKAWNYNRLMIHDSILLLHAF